MTMLAHDTAFDPRAPLPPGVTLLEASAGTGKTHTITSVIVREVARGTPLDRILAVTFTRMATGELRERVRARLMEAHDALAAADIPKDEVLADLAGEDRDRHRERLAQALAGFDAATIATTHGFCQQVLDSLGVAADTDRDVRFVEDLSGLVTQTVEDVYVWRYRDDPAPALGLEVARALGSLAVANRFARIVPDAVQDETPAGVRVRFVHRIRREFRRRARLAGVASYDDQIGRLFDTLERDRDEACAARLAERFDLVLIDEFQDTDPAQWDIVRRAFPTQRVLLIGDPKQAIYAFRGGDVHTYLRARRSAAARHTLDRNWRSDRPLLDALDALFRDVGFGEEIDYRSVEPAPGNAAPGLAGAPVPAPLRFRLVRRADGHVDVTTTGFAQKNSAIAHIADDLAAQIAAMLAAGARVRTRGDAWRDLRPGDVGVLVPYNKHAEPVREALVRAGVPAVVSGAGSVFTSEAATDWLRLLEALERPADPARASAAALTAFIGWDAGQLASCPEDERDRLHARLHAWRGVITSHGVAALAEALMRAESVAARVLACDGGERLLTDLRHVGQLLHAHAAETQAGVSALVDWLGERTTTPDPELGEDGNRRLESDREAVQILTIHRSKGLEFPVVCLPYMWDPGRREDSERVCVPLFHDPDHDDARTLDVGGAGTAGWKSHLDLSRAEARAEDLRRAYVALTRARHQVIVWWAGAHESERSALDRLIAGPGGDGAMPVTGPKKPTDDAMRARLEKIAAAAPAGCIAVETTGPSGARWEDGVVHDPGALHVAVLDRPVDMAWGRYSYSRLTHGSYEARVASEPELGTRGDEPAPGAEAAADARPAGDLPLGAQPAGTAFGSLVHAVLETTDLAAPDLEAAVAEAVAVRVARGARIDDPGALADGLVAACRTPLGAALGGLRLCDVTTHDRLDELGFELPLAGGDSPGGRLAVDDLAGLLAAHLPAGDPLAGYPAVLRAAGLDRELRGFMVGAIDLVVRLPGPRFAVIDHKTNLLGGAAGPALADYHPDRLAEEMAESHYVLQALLYQVALHRYLRWRVAGYDPGTHLAGAHYLFLRGLAGPDADPLPDGRVHGVFSWVPDAALVAAASDLLDRGAAG